MVTTASSTRRIAWEGFSFHVPGNWEMAYHHSDRRRTNVQLEDDYTRRLELDRYRLRDRPRPPKVRRAYRRKTASLQKEASSIEEIRSLPEGWIASLYHFPERQRVVTAYFIPRQSHAFFFFRIHYITSITTMGMNID